MAEQPHRVTRALLSVSDKSGLIEFARALANLGIELISTGGTSRALADAGLTVRDVSDVTGFPGNDGWPRQDPASRRCTARLLAVRGNEAHEHAMATHGIAPIDLLVVNLYPFEATVAKGAGFDECVENIDIGGPAMIRAAAKNHAGVDGRCRARRLRGGAGGDRAARRNHTRASQEARRQGVCAHRRLRRRDFQLVRGRAWRRRPDFRAFGGRLIEALRYGENPHQTAAFYRTPERRFGVASARQVQGKQLSYNNINDTDAAYECVAEFDPARIAACAIIKHANPCGVAEGGDLIEAYRKALACDPVSAFGGIVALNRPLDADAARAITEIFTEVIIAPAANDEAIAIVGAKKNLAAADRRRRSGSARRGLIAKTVAGGLLVQSRDNASVDEMQLRTVTRRAPKRARACRSALRVPGGEAREVEHHRLRKGPRHGRHRRRTDEPRSIQRASPLARRRTPPKSPARASRLTRGAVVASDAFFPFADGLLVAIEAGATAVIQPGGSVRDDEVIKAADDHGSCHGVHRRASLPALRRVGSVELLRNPSLLLRRGK